VKINNLKNYQYDVWMNVPKSTPTGIYPYELCGHICQEGYFGQLCLGICKTGKVIVR